MGIELVNRGFELRSFLSKYNGIGISKLKNNNLKYYPDNPTVEYPVDHKEKKLIFGSTWFQSLFGRRVDLSANIHEQVWVKFGGNVPISDYTRNYVTLYTAFWYKRIK